VLYFWCSLEANIAVRPFFPFFLSIENTKNNFKFNLLKIWGNLASKQKAAGTQGKTA
jgi:hypothetical protein